MNSRASPELERFIRGTLGCRCPDDAFRSVVTERADCHRRLVVGDRLLIYVTAIAPGCSVGQTVARLTERGLAERDAIGLNRFRLVVASSQPAEVVAEAESGFASSAGGDERVHLHVIASDQLPTELEWPD